MQQRLEQINHVLEEIKQHPVLEKQGQFLYINAHTHLLSVSADVFELKVEEQFKDYEIKIETGETVTHECSCGVSGICEHKAAALLRIKEALTNKPDQAPQKGYAYTKEGMIKRVLQERIDKAKQADFKIELNENIFGEHSLTSESGQEYHLTLHNFKDKQGYCSCPDYQHNKLGTCKHLIFAFQYLKENEGRFKRKKHFFPFIEVFLDPLNDYRIAYFYPHQLDLFTKSLLDKYFKGKTYVDDDDVADLLGFFEEAPQHKQIRIRPEVLKKVDAIFNEQALIELEETTDFRGKFEQLYPNVKLLNYQIEGARFATFREAAIIADDMGLGKTKQAIAAALMKQQFFGFGRTLVICPVSLKSQWFQEIESFTEGISAIADGTPEQREGVYSGFKKQFLIAGYETVVRDFEQINALNFDYIILDEAQRIKDYESKTATIIKRLQRKHALVITGTPIENRLVDIYSIVDFLDKRLLAPLWEFSYKYCYFESHTSNKITGYHNLDQLRERLSHIMIRREREEVLTQLPQVQEYDIPIELYPEQYAQQHDIAQQLKEILQKNYLTPFDHQRIFQLINRMRMVANSTYLLDNSTNFSKKTDEIEHILIDKLNIGTKNTKIVIFSEWKKMAHILAFAIRRKGLKVIELNGDVPSNKRAELIADFENEKNSSVFITTGAGSKGLNLQVADTIINVEIPHSQQEKQQRTGRIVRLGQRSRQLTVMNLVAKNSIEEFVKLQNKNKTKLFDKLFEENADNSTFSENVQQQLQDIVERLIAHTPIIQSHGDDDEIRAVFQKGLDFFTDLYEHYNGKALPRQPKIEILDNEIILHFPKTPN